MKLPFYLLEDGEVSEENGGIVYSTPSNDRALLIKKTLDAGHVIYGFENNIISRLLTKLQMANIRNSWYSQQLTQREIDKYDYLNNSPFRLDDEKALFKVTSVDVENRTVEIEILEDNPDAIGESVSFHFVCVWNKQNNTMSAVGVATACFNDK